jgi:hypothetical protein
MTKPIPDKAEVALEYSDKLYMGTFERTARFDAHLDDAGISLSLYRTGDADVRKSFTCISTMRCSQRFSTTWQEPCRRYRRAMRHTAMGCGMRPRRSIGRSTLAATTARTSNG